MPTVADVVAAAVVVAAVAAAIKFKFILKKCNVQKKKSILKRMASKSESNNKLCKCLLRIDLNSVEMSEQVFTARLETNRPNLSNSTKTPNPN
jgi:hypothetical protein